MEKYFTSSPSTSIPLTMLTPQTWEQWISGQDDRSKAWVESHNFMAKPGQLLIIPQEDGQIKEVIWAYDGETDFWQWSAVAQKVPAKTYHLSHIPPQADLICLAWGLAFYQFDRYKSPSSKPYPQLTWPKSVDAPYVLALLDAITMIRDLITTPACDCLPHHLAEAAQNLALLHDAQCKIIMDETLKLDYPSIYTVGKAATAQPCLIDLTWTPSHPLKKVTLVGKGVCFDSGGLDIKSSSNMLLMKKDMGGAAHVLGLAHLIMTLDLPIQLRVLIPAVENAISGNAMRPLDIIHTKKGISVEIGNTDAEGRLILADALFEACTDHPDLIMDFATLTGAARIAMGTDVPAFFCNHEETANMLIESAQLTQDPLWRLPLYQGYKKYLRTPTADLSSTGKSSYGGAITAALFLEHFIDNHTPWIHVDLMAWNLNSTPGRPEGGEAMGLRSAFHFLRQLVENA